MALEQEIQQYRLHLADILGETGENIGKYVVIKADQIQGILPTYEEALKVGYDRNGLTSFLVKKIERVEPVMYFARDLR